MHEGIPLQGKFECKQDDLLRRLDYENHLPLQKVTSEVRQAFAKEEAASYHIHIPRFIACFIYRLFLCPISWVIRKGKGLLSSTPPPSSPQMTLVHQTHTFQKLACRVLKMNALPSILVMP